MALVRWLIVMSFVVCISTSSFFLSDYLNKRLKNNNFSNVDYQFALLLYLPPALQLALIEHEKFSPKWLTYARLLAAENGEIALQLANYYSERHQQAPAVFWFEQAIKLHQLDAQVELAQFYFNLGEQAKASSTLRSTAITSLSAEGLLLAAELAIAAGELDKLPSLLVALAENNPKIYQEVTAELVEFSILTNIDLPTINDVEQGEGGSHCNNSIQPYATTLADLRYGRQLIAQFLSHPLSTQLCFKSFRYIRSVTLDCMHANEQRIHCNEAQWFTKIAEIDSKYLLVLLPHGGANTHLGIIYLDRNDPLSVLAHEVSHLFGFVDEYPLPNNHKKCDLTTDEYKNSANLLIAKPVYSGEHTKLREQILAAVPWREHILPDTPILTASLSSALGEKKWQLGTPDSHLHQIGLFPTKTCDGRKSQAFKPIFVTTPLEYQELDWPTQYLNLLNKEGQFAMPSFHYNVALALNNNSQAKKLLVTASMYEVNQKKKARILSASF